MRFLFRLVVLVMVVGVVAVPLSSGYRWGERDVATRPRVGTSGRPSMPRAPGVPAPRSPGRSPKGPARPERLSKRRA